MQVYARRQCVRSRRHVASPYVSLRYDSSSRQHKIEQCCSRTFSSSSFRPNGLDHVCVAVKDVDVSLDWYERVLDFKHKYADESSFGKNPAFLQNGNAKIALIPLARSQTPVKNHNGAHFAFNVDREEFDRMRVELPKRLGCRVEEQDYDLQLSIFFSDPDSNILEITTWIDPSDPKRL